jgi:hypothetical protein
MQSSGVSRRIRKCCELLLSEALFKKLDELLCRFLGILAMQLESQASAFGRGEAHDADNGFRVDFDALHFDEKIGLETGCELDDRSSRPGVEPRLVSYDNFLDNHSLSVLYW